MGDNDTWIAATASVLNATLLTTDHLAGKLSPEAFAQEEGLLEQLLESNGQQPNKEHLLRYLEQWRRFKTRRS